jgi:hypothetical protein
MSSVGPANSELEARQSWTSRYPFEPYGSGLGASLACTTSSGRVALSGTTVQVNCALICNTGSVWVFVLFGDVTVAATTSCMAVPPGACSLVSLTTQGQAIPTHIAGITASGSATIQVTLGYGGN